jgi:SAM-dependent methyltransferase
MRFSFRWKEHHIAARRPGAPAHDVHPDQIQITHGAAHARLRGPAHAPARTTVHAPWSTSVLRLIADGPYAPALQVREGLTSILRCPRCGTDGSLRLTAARCDAREVRDGELACARCEQRYRITDGIVDLLFAPADFVRRERAGLDRFAEVMRADGWDRERILALPDVDLPYWHGQRQAIDALLQRTAFQPGERLLDVGSNTCWASNIFAARGLEVIALDIATAELQGLRTADYFIDRGEVFFERLLSVMFEPALADDSVDHVFCCEVLHHNDHDHLRASFRELHRVLRPGGRLFVVNEPLRFPLRLKRDHGQEVAQFEGNEHVYFFHEYYLAARRAGFEVSLPSLAQRSNGSRLRGLARSVWRRLLRGDLPLTMDCRKPA